MYVFLFLANSTHTDHNKLPSVSPDLRKSKLRKGGICPHKKSTKDLNCFGSLPSSSLTQHFALSETLVLMLGHGKGTWGVYQNLMLILLLSFSFCFYYRAEKAASCLLPNTCLGIATYIIARFESNEVGLTWDKVSASPTPEDDFSFSMVLGMFIIQSIIYGIIAWYVILHTSRYGST